MKAKELRIGNLISTPNEKIDTINEIGFKETKEDKRDYYLGFEKTHAKYFIKNENKLVISPISITKEWLFKLGFGSSNESECLIDINNDVYIVFNYHFNTCEIFTNKNEYWVSHIKYIHQLQNLYFALTNKELKINLK